MENDTPKLFLRNFFVNDKKIITRKIEVVGKNCTFKKSFKISFSIEKKIKKGGYKQIRFDD